MFNKLRIFALRGHCDHALGLLSTPLDGLAHIVEDRDGRHCHSALRALFERLT